MAFCPQVLIFLPQHENTGFLPLLLRPSFSPAPPALPPYPCFYCLCSFPFRCLTLASLTLASCTKPGSLSHPCSNIYPWYLPLLLSFVSVATDPPSFTSFSHSCSFPVTPHLTPASHPCASPLRLTSFCPHFLCPSSTLAPCLCPLTLLFPLLHITRV